MPVWQFIVLTVLLLIVAALLVVLLLRQARLETIHDTEDLQDDLVRIGEQVRESTRTSAEYNYQLRREVTGALQEGLKTQSEQLLAASKLETETLSRLQDRLLRILGDSLDRMQASNEERLTSMEQVVNEKLDKTLNDRLDTSFKTVSEQLGRLYRSLGELEALSSGVNDLNRTLSNVKTRGTWGEVQLGRILEQTMPRSQYEVNVATKRHSDDRVEYAILFPAQDGTEETVYLPIDAKFPSDIYLKIAEAAEQGDQEKLALAVSELRRRILLEARTIRDKYLDPPRTTNYGIMFLPTEGLYAEVLRVDGLTEKCQELGIIVAGPTTITAILNSLTAGFRTIALSKKSVEVMKLLEAVKAQFGKLDEEVSRTQKKLAEAAASADRLSRRTGIIGKRMRTIAEIDPGEAERLLALDAMGEENFGDLLSDSEDS